MFCHIIRLYIGYTFMLSCVTLAICSDHPRRRSPLKIFMRDRIRELVIYFKFHENRLRGLRAVGVENRPLLLTWPMTYTTACILVQAVINSHITTTNRIFSHHFMHIYDVHTMFASKLLSHFRPVQFDTCN